MVFIYTFHCSLVDVVTFAVFQARVYFRGTLTLGMYAIHLLPWFEVIPRDNILLLRSEDYFENRTDVINKIRDFLGLGNDYKKTLCPINNRIKQSFVGFPDKDMNYSLTGPELRCDSFLS